MYPWAVPHRAGDTLTCAQNVDASLTESERARFSAGYPARVARASRPRGTERARFSAGYPARGARAGSALRRLEGARFHVSMGRAPQGR